MTDQNVGQAVEDQVDIVTADGQRGRVSSATARHMITYNGARIAPRDQPAQEVEQPAQEELDVEPEPTEEPPAVPDNPWADDGAA